MMASFLHPVTMTPGHPGLSTGIAGFVSCSRLAVFIGVLYIDVRSRRPIFTEGTSTLSRYAAVWISTIHDNPYRHLFVVFRQCVYCNHKLQHVIRM